MTYLLLESISKAIAVSKKGKGQKL